MFPDGIEAFFFFFFESLWKGDLSEVPESIITHFEAVLEGVWSFGP